MTRLYSSFDLDQILADDLAKKARELQETEVAARREKSAVKREALGKKDAPAAVPSDAVPPVAPLIMPVSLRDLDLSRFRLEENTAEYHLFGLPVGAAFIDLALMKERLHSGCPYLQTLWRVHPEYRTIGKRVYDLPSGPEFEAIVEAAAAYHPVGHGQSHLLSGLKRLVVADLTSTALSRSRVHFFATGRDALSHDYGAAYVMSVDLKGSNVRITPTSGLDAELGALLSTTTARYCEARELLGVVAGALFRWETPHGDWESPLSVGLSVNCIQRDGPARGVRYLSQKDAGGRS